MLDEFIKAAAQSTKHMPTPAEYWEMVLEAGRTFSELYDLEHPERFKQAVMDRAMEKLDATTDA
jgi:hypothetical protein